LTRLPTRHLLAFRLTAFAFIAVPGPSVLFVISRSLTRKAGLATVVGNALGVYRRGARLGRSGGDRSRSDPNVAEAQKPRPLEVIGGAGGLAMIGIGTRPAFSGQDD
jgi:hypothetical protein